MATTTSTPINWQYVAHIAVGTIITACQSIAMVDTAPNVVNWCHVVSLVTINLGISLGVWQATAVVQMRRDMAMMTERSQPAPVPVLAAPAKVEEPKKDA